MWTSCFRVAPLLTPPGRISRYFPADNNTSQSYSPASLYTSSSAVSSSYRNEQRRCCGTSWKVSPFTLRSFFLKSSFPGHFFRSEEHTSELQSRENLVCRLLLEKKNTHQ